MSFEQLMESAKQIEEEAAKAEYRQWVTSGGDPADFDHERTQAKYQNCAQPLFEPFTRIPDPGSYQGLIDDLHGAMSCLSHGAHMEDPTSGKSIGGNEDLKAIETAATSLSGWSGEAAYAFKANFLDPFPAVASNQFLVLGVLKGAVEADQEVWKKTREDIEMIASDTLAALDNVGSCGKSDLKFALSVVTAVSAVGAIPFTGSTSAAVVAAVSAGSLVGGATQQGYEWVKGSGASAEQVVNSMKSAIDELTKRIQDQEGKISKALNGYADVVDQQNAENSPFVSKRPKLSGMEGQALTSGKGIGGHD